MQPIVSDVPWSGCVSVHVCVCLLDMTMSCAQTDEPIKVLLGLLTRLCLCSHVSGGSLDLLCKGQFSGGGRPPLRCGFISQFFDQLLLMFFAVYIVSVV